MSPILPRRTAVAHLYEHCRSLALVPTPSGSKVVPVRTMRSVLLAVARYLDAATWAGAFPSMATLAARAEVSVTTARRAVRALEAAGVLATDVGGGRRSSRYRIVRPEPAPRVVDRDRDRPARSRGSTNPRFSTRSCPDGQERRSAAPRAKIIPDDLVPLADALADRGLRASFSLTSDQIADVRSALADHGVSTLIRAAYAAHRATDPARWWSAYISVWSGLRRQPERIPRAPQPQGAVASPEVRAAAAAMASEAISATLWSKKSRPRR